MNPSDREFYPLRDAGNPASGARSRRVVDMRGAPAPRNIGINETEGSARKPRPPARLSAVAPEGFALPERRNAPTVRPTTHDYQSGYAAGRRSIDVPAWLLSGFVSGVVLALLVVWFGSMLLAGL